ncbi:hypothetical protein ANI_1_316094 [Paecilomyces variotii No. 5]|uniref:Uncharacterized protein n=1 Tax=Byssochlamys spectabilis (strain No. 5 / NBRC 109023) TaxID=1356009 RepID=V5I3B3_BYSSN|nr:hypothetical protein ANI_1_316094 [Paecilomyces variotii No. 5]
MPSRLSTPVLTVDAGKIRKVDTASVQSLHGMWMVFSKCADYMEEGRRLENLSWRLWTRETFCVEPENECDTSVLPLLRQEAPDLPELSASVESAASDQAERIESHIKRPRTLEHKPTVVSDDYSIRTGKEKHITSVGLERMVMNIKEKKNLEPLSPIMTPVVTTSVVDVTPRPSSPTPSPTPSPATIAPSTQTAQAPTRPTPVRHPLQSTESCSTTAPEANDSDAAVTAGSDTSVSSGAIPTARSGLVKSPSIVRGFSPSQVSASYRSQAKLAPEPRRTETSPQPTLKPSPLMKRKGGMFTLGGSSGDDESSFEERMASPAPHRSSLAQELQKPKTATPSPNKKVASFKDTVETRHIKPIKEIGPEDEDAIETEDEISESAIEDDEDSSDWEDSVTESGRSSVDDKELFQRVDSRPNLVSRRSLLTMMMHQPEKMGSRSTPALARSRLSSPNGPSIPASPPEEDEESLTMRGPDVPRSKPIIVRPTAQQPVAHSPRTTRRNMLATELTESLRRHLLWERQQKSATANAVFKRRHTAQDMANLREYPGPKGSQRGQRPGQESSQAKDKDTSSWTNYNDYGPWEYHAKGW